MPTEIEESGYEDFRSYAMSNWNYLELKEGNTTKYTIDITDSWVQDPENDGSSYVIQVKEVVTGAEIGLDTTVDTSALYDNSTDMNLKHTNTQASFTFQTEDDELTIKHRIEIPQQA